MKIAPLSAVVIISFFYPACDRSGSQHFEASGIVEGTSVKVTSQTPGLIMQMRVDEGDEVEQSQIIAVLDTVRLSLQIEQIQAGFDELLVQRQINLNTLTSAESDFNNIDTRFKRIQELFKKNSASQQSLDDMKTAHSAARTQLQNARQNLKILESKRKGLRAQWKLLRQQIADASPAAPVAGTVTAKYFEAGETLLPGQPLVEIIDLNQMWTKIYISEKLLAGIRTGDPATVQIDGMDTTLEGHVSWISPKAEFTPKTILTDETRTSLVYAVKILLDNPERSLKHGMPVKITLSLPGKPFEVTNAEG